MNTGTLIEVGQEGHVGTIQLSRPDKFNCLSMDLFQEIDSCLTSFEENPEISALVISGKGKHFCTGAQLDEVMRVRKDGQLLRQFIECGHRVLNRLEQSRLPVCVAIEGLCLAGGLELVMACDVAFAGRSAKIGDQHGQFGLIPGWGGTQRLPMLVGRRRALDLQFSVRWLDANEACSWGLVNYVVDDDCARLEALKYAQTIATRSRAGISTMKRLAIAPYEKEMKPGKEMEIEAAVELLMSQDVTEGLSAFKEKRVPQFK